MTAAEDEAFELARVVAALASRHWGPATAAASADLGELWRVAAEKGWFDLGPAGALAPALGALRELGRVACPLPLMDGYVASRLLIAHEQLVAEISSGTLRVLVAAVAEKPATAGNSDGAATHLDAAGAADRAVPYLDAAGATTHVLLLPPGGGRATLHPVIALRPTPGLAVPAWSEVVLGRPATAVDLDATSADEAVVLLRLGLAVRALGAAERAHELAVEHAKVRRQFGRLIGSFGAVQQRAAAGQIDLSAGAVLVAEALRLHDSSSPQWTLAAEIATAHVRATAPRVQLASHHTLAATGYFEEHEAPWLFRRLHADLARLQTLARVAGEVGDVLVETGSMLPDFDAGPEGTVLRSELRAWIGEEPGRSGRISVAADDEEVVSAMAARGYLGLGWPAAAGGRDATPAEQMVLHEEVAYGRVPAIGALSSVMLIGNAILRHGSPEQQQRFLPLIRQGELSFCLGYSEPEAGSDLASLRTTAVREGDGWVINGQKLWTTGAHRAHWVWLATRTDPDASPPQAGITVFLLPMDTPGITIQEHRALSGEISCTVTYDDVRVPDSARVGEAGGGWRVITDALAGERIVMGGVASGLHRQLDDLLEVVRADPETIVGGRDSAKRARLGGLAVSLQATRALVVAATNATARADARLEAAMAGVMGGELAEDFGEGILEILGPEAALSAGEPGVPGGGAFEYGLRLSMMYVIGGGTNDVQRGLIARALGLPR
ncbi:MAG TPA: acyl-CoA dehydrogenase family protein [Acidimicrobiales bacterium]|nr:acyl-CoA dehydrogenase family protein [Acidimicrobiales bacterium]